MSSPNLPRVDPATARAWLESGKAALIDVREPDEHARERIAGARLTPIARLEAGSRVTEPGKTVVFHCNTGNRTTQAAALLARVGGGNAYELEGGLQAWKRAGLPVVVDREAPLPLMRQVQIAAGSLVLLGTVLTAAVSPWLLVIPAFVGAGLVVAGITGFCGMARLLARMPWNHGRGTEDAGAPAAAAP
jgi:rhodanese-related sulfurtransferase